MNRVRLNKNKRTILISLVKYNYPAPVPDKDLRDFLELEDLGFVTHLKLDQGSLNKLYGPQITETGRRYLVENPKLKNPRIKIDWKWLIGIIVTLMIAGATIWFSK